MVPINGMGADPWFFSEPVIYDVLADSRQLIAGDFSGAGHLDIATSEILAGDGRGGFAAATSPSYSTSGVIGALAAADFDSDGKLDLVIGYGSSVLEVVHGDGRGGIDATTASSSFSLPRCLAVGDWDFDGKLDFAAAGHVNSSPTVSLFLGNGTGHFTLGPQFPVGVEPYQCVAADLNGDSQRDLVLAAAGSNSASVLLADGRGGFAPVTNYTVGSRPYGVAVSDFNQDGRLDLVVSNSMSRSVSLLPGDGQGGFGSARSIPLLAAPYSLAVGDFNSDGKPDLAIASHGDGDSQAGLSILLGDGAFGFHSAGDRLLPSDGWIEPSVVAADWNGDGKLDLAAAAGLGISIFLNQFKAP